MNDSTMWGYLKREGNLDELLRKSPAPKDSYLSAQLNLIIEIDNVDISKEENQINLFNDNPGGQTYLPRSCKSDIQIVIQ